MVQILTRPTYIVCNLTSRNILLNFQLIFCAKTYEKKEYRYISTDKTRSGYHGLKRIRLTKLSLALIIQTTQLRFESHVFQHKSKSRFD
jgi:hypothetical protein